MKKIIKIMIAFVAVAGCLPATAQKFTASFTAVASDKPFSGKVLLYLSKESKSPKDNMPGVFSFPCFNIDVKNVKPGEKVTLDDNAAWYPTPLSDIERGTYYAQVVWDRNLGGRDIAASPGNMYNKTVTVTITKDRAQTFNITCTEVIAEPAAFTETQFIKELKAPSALLTAFYKRPTTVNAAVILPKEYNTQPNRRFPVLYWVSGYGGDYHAYSNRNISSDPIDTTACIRVYLDGNCPGGHSVYANSDNNGPWGDALTTELIPLVDKAYRTNAARLLTGHSSGGWTVLWLQTHYPRVFNACWSSSPDPVDFRSFQQVDLYKEKNLYYAKDSSMHLAATIAGRYPWITMKNMCAMEHVIWRGQQMHSFNFVFSTRNADGTPRSLWNDATGDLDPVTFEHWKNYDISLYLRSNWPQIKPDLQGKIRVSVGSQDNFLLNYAVQLLEGEVKKLDAGFVIQYYPGDHFTVSTPEYKAAGYRFLEEKYNEMGIKN